MKMFRQTPDKRKLMLSQLENQTALRRQSAIHREAFAAGKVLDLAKPYLFQSSSPVNYLFSDASSISYVARNKPFSSFLQTLSENLSMFPSLIVVHFPGRPSIM